MTVGEYVTAASRALGRIPRVGLVGFGVTNRAVYSRLCTISDTVVVRQNDPTALPHGVCGIFGEGYLEGIFEDILFLSPSVRRDVPPLIKAAERGVILTSECEVFFTDSGKNATRTPTYAVTGSDGKSTVTSMAAAMLHAAAVGNIGVPYSECEGANGYVCELSSFNLQYLAPRSDACVITNITPNHLNWHSSFDEYLSAKANVLTNSRRIVLNADDEACLSLLRGGEVLFSARRSDRELYALGAAHAIYICDGSLRYDGEEIIPVCELALGQGYNILNFMAAIGLSYGECEAARIREVGRTFRSLAHRCELVHESADGVRFYDSSIDTTPERTRVTLEGLGQPVLLLLGGRGKRLSFEPLIESVASHATAVAVYGEVREELGELFDRDERLDGIPFSTHEDFDGALAALISRAGKGDAVLLSPAATAYGEFSNFEKRGERFAKLARQLCP